MNLLFCKKCQYKNVDTKLDSYMVGDVLHLKCRIHGVVKSGVLAGPRFQPRTTAKVGGGFSNYPRPGFSQ